MKVCYVVNSVSETSVPATLATALVDYENVDVDILAWFEAEPFAGDDRVADDCLGASRSEMGMNPRTLQTACEILQGYDVIQAHTNHSGVLAKVVGQGLGAGIVSREGNTRDGFTRKGRVANGVTNALADRVVPNSRAVYESFHRWEKLLIDEEDVRIIPNGVDLERIDTARNSDYDIHDQFDIPEDSVVIGTTSVISKQKALDILVEAVARVTDQTETRVDLVIVGDGPRRSHIADLVQRLGLDECVHFAGMVERNTVYQILGEIDVYAMPSRWEGFSNAAVEALGAGNACLFSDIDPFLFPYRNVAVFHDLDDPADLAQQLTELVENEELREFCANKGRELVAEKYTLERVANQYFELYTEIV